MHFAWRCCAVVAFTLLAGASAQGGNVDVLTSRGDAGRTGANLSETLLTTENVNRDAFGLLFAYDLSGDDGRSGGDVFAQPLVVSRVGIPNKGVRNLIVVATTKNLIFALDADGPAPGEDGVLWKRQLGAPPTIEQMLKGDVLCHVPGEGCTNIRPGGHVGIMSTPAIDRERGVVFVASRTIDSQDHIHHNLHALDLKSGQDLAGSPIEMQGSASGVQFEAQYQNQRVGLALAKGQVIVAFGSHQDKQPYHGWVMSYRYDGTGFVQTGIFVTTPTGDTSWPVCAFLLNNCAHGGIWQTGRAPAVDPDGRVLLFVGNGKNDLRSDSTNVNFGNSFLALDPVSLEVLDFFTPSNHSIPVPDTLDQGTGLNELDLDLGGSGPMIIPDSPFVIGGGKQGVIHVWRLESLGGFSPTDASVVQKFPGGDEVARPFSRPDYAGEDSGFAVNWDVRSGHIMGGPVFWPRSRDSGGSLLFNWSEDSELRSYSVDPAASIPIESTPLAKGPDFQFGHPGGILTLSANRDARQSGIIWAATYDTDNDTVDALNEVRPGILRAYAADSLQSLWTSEDVPDRDRLGAFAKFVPPTVANGRVYMATFSNQLVVYGLREHRYVRAAAQVLGASIVPLLADLLFDD